jgi:hypothetical protein
MPIAIKKAYSISSLIHLAVFLLASGVLFKSCSKSNAPDNQGHSTGNIAELSKTVDVDVVTKDQIKGPRKPKVVNKAPTLKCPKNWYGGIGVQNTFDTEGRTILVYVPKGYPAYDAGLEMGDELIDGCPNCKGPVGEEVNFWVKKPNSSLKQYFLIREKICTEDIS